MKSRPPCLWCSKPLARRPSYAATEAEVPQGARVTRRPRTERTGSVSYVTEESSLGPYGDGFFCSLTHGYYFGVAAASVGYRMKRETP